MGILGVKKGGRMSRLSLVSTRPICFPVRAIQLSPQMSRKMAVNARQGNREKRNAQGPDIDCRAFPDLVRCRALPRPGHSLPEQELARGDSAARLAYQAAG
ncbi:hypothetical protein GCM10008966_01930 [Rhodovulum strictum]